MVGVQRLRLGHLLKSIILGKSLLFRIHFHPYYSESSLMRSIDTVVYLRNYDRLSRVWPEIENYPPIMASRLVCTISEFNM